MAGTIGGTAAIAAATPADASGHTVTICHATASATNPYVVITVDVASIGDTSGHGRSGVNAGDIIPPFDIAGVHYDGNNVNLLGNTSGCPLPPPGNSGSGDTNF
jgi:hypothetical protein